MVVPNDTRGWVMTVVSGIACTLGASIICVDLIIQRLPCGHGFQIQNSNNFLSASLSLSAGVMLFSSLYSMLPSANTYLKATGISAAAAGYALIGSFLGGVIVIQFISVILHRFMPSHVVDCDHSHDDHDHSDEGHVHESESENLSLTATQSEQTPLLSQHHQHPRDFSGNTESHDSDSTLVASSTLRPGNQRRPPLLTSFSQKLNSFISGDKAGGHDSGPCYGFSNPCAHECYKHVRNNCGRSMSTPNARLPLRKKSLVGRPKARPSRLDEEASIGTANEASRPIVSRCSHSSSHESLKQENEEALEDSSATHHHHVPQNQFMSIGLQTLIAIALHKMPEGFITYATNHANPRLGFAVFMALFIHNLTEGFVMALPLYLAVGSRWKAILYSSVLGGLTQPLGAGIAAAWFKIAGGGDMAPGQGVYGVMFAVTAGVMTSVALSLFSESVALYHNRPICIIFAFIGMGVLGFSFALTA